MSILLLCFLVAADGRTYEGKGILNLVTIGDDYKLEDFKEIDDFSAFYMESEQGDNLVWFTLEIDPQAKLGSSGNGARPTLVLQRDKKDVAVIGLPVQNQDRSSKDFGQLLEWRVGAEFDDNSHCMFQLHPNSKNYVTIILPFSAAEATYVSKDKKKSKMSFSELRKKLAVTKK
jgi:hypothetical protein